MKIIKIIASGWPNRRELKILCFIMAVTIAALTVQDQVMHWHDVKMGWSK